MRRLFGAFSAVTVAAAVALAVAVHRGDGPSCNHVCQNPDRYVRAFGPENISIVIQYHNSCISNTRSHDKSHAHHLTLIRCKQDVTMTREETNEVVGVQAQSKATNFDWPLQLSSMSGERLKKNAYATAHAIWRRDKPRHTTTQQH